MSLYGPLTDAFKEFNQLLIGQQQWKGQQALNESTQRRNDLVLQSQLQNQAFQQEIQRSAQGLNKLRYMGDREDAAAATAHQKVLEDHWLAQEDVAQQQANTAAAAQIATSDHLGNVDRLASENQDFQNKLALRNEERTEEELTSTLATSEANLTRLKNENQKYANLHTPMEIDASTFMSRSPEVWDNPEANDMFEKVSGLRIGADNIVYDAITGEPQHMTVDEFNRKVLPRMQSVVTAMDDEPLKVERRVDQLKSTMQKLESAGKEIQKKMGMSANAKGKSALAYNKQAINEIKGRLATESAKLSKESQIAYWQDKAEDLMAFSRATASDKQISDLYAKEAATADARATELFDAREKRILADAKAEAAAAKEAKTYPKVAADHLNDLFSMKGGNLIPGLPAQLNAKRAMAMRMTGYFGKRPVSTQEEAFQYATKAYEWTRATHNNLRSEMADIVKTLDGALQEGTIDQDGYDIRMENAKNRWTAKAMKALTYLPEDSFENQVEQQDITEERLQQLITQYQGQ